MADENSTDDMNSASNETTEPVAESAESVEETLIEEATPKKPVSAERAADVTLGVGVVTFEALDRVARSLDATVRRLVEDSPSVFAELEEKGRPVREKIAEVLRGKASTDGAASGGSGANAVDEITALEDRVRELEQQVGSEPSAPPAEPSPFSMLEIDPPAEAPEPPKRSRRKSEDRPEEKSEEPVADE